MVVVSWANSVNSYGSVQHLNAVFDHGQKVSSQFEFIKTLQGYKKGDNVEGIKDFKKYMERFGYLNPNRPSHDDHFDDILESAVKTYQLNFNLNTTGTLDPQTVSTMMMPRCGVPDIINGTTRMRSGYIFNQNNYFHVKYAFFPGQPKWPKGKKVLKYEFGEGTREDVKDPLGRAASTWQPYTPFTFEHFNVLDQSDIRVSFKSRAHGDGKPFDGPGGILAHAFSPTDGRLHFDADENWAVGAVPDAFDMQTVALHELGHILGLQHSSVQDAIMWPTLFAGKTKGLNDDDIQGIKALYAGY
ncbi:hypothetical protein QYF36_010475 [Acer negundo]|nr:hypothetical protein QYF36_010475 [Acer negundo]